MSVEERAAIARAYRPVSEKLWELADRVYDMRTRATSKTGWSTWVDEARAVDEALVALGYSIDMTNWNQRCVPARQLKAEDEA